MRHVTMTVQQQVTSADETIEELAPQPELARARPAEPGQEPLEEGVFGQRLDVMVEENDAKGTVRSLRDRLVDRCQVLAFQQSVAGMKGSIVRTGRIEQDQVESQDAAARRGDLYPRSGHHLPGSRDAEAIVIAGDDRHPVVTEERGKERLEPFELLRPAVVREISSHHNVIDPGVDEGAAEIGGPPILGVRLSDMEVRNVSEGRSPHEKTLGDLGDDDATGL